MKKAYILIFALIVFAMVLTFADAEHILSTAFMESAPQGTIEKVSENLICNVFDQDDDIHAVPEIKFPASLQFIDDEAFEGTSLVAVDLPDTVEKIGNRVFANISSLRMLQIPQKTTIIGHEIVAGSNNVIITATPGSYAKKWAKENGLPFAPIAAMMAKDMVSPVLLFSVQRTEAVGTVEDTDDANEEKPAVRAFGEIKDERYEEGIAYHIQGRSPPVCT